MKKLNSYEDCEKSVFLTLIVKYAKILFLKIYIQFIFFATLEPAKPLNDAQMCGSFYFYTHPWLRLFHLAKVIQIHTILSLCYNQEDCIFQIQTRPNKVGLSQWISLVHFLSKKCHSERKRRISYTKERTHTGSLLVILAHRR